MIHCLKGYRIDTESVRASIGPWKKPEPLPSASKYFLVLQGFSVKLHSCIYILHSAPTSMSLFNNNIARRYFL
jgi:hypothetical protein